MFDQYFGQAGAIILEVDRDILRSFLEHFRGRGLPRPDYRDVILRPKLVL